MACLSLAFKWFFPACARAAAAATGFAVWLAVATALAAPGDPAGDAAAAAAGSAPVATGRAVRTSGLPIPRFVSLRSTEVNVRTGPGIRYPVEWVFVRKDMPVEITAEFDTWRRIRDWDGSEGWVHQSLLSGRRTVIVVGTVRSLRADPDPRGRVVARVEPGVIGELQRCRPARCEIAFGDHLGWLGREEVWGLYSEERIE